MKTTEKSHDSIQEKRAYLKELSKGFSLLKKEGAIESVNDGLREFYAQDGHKVLKTLKQWNEEGKRVKKGERALLLWAKPVGTKPAESEPGSEEDEAQFFPLCFVFSNLQVQEGK
jgi:hypothetical protein